MDLSGLELQIGQERDRAYRLRNATSAVNAGKTVNNGWGGFECCWARTLLATLVGALEVPGGTLSFGLPTQSWVWLISGLQPVGHR